MNFESHAEKKNYQNIFFWEQHLKKKNLRQNQAEFQVFMEGGKWLLANCPH